jgi:hypothetical protein
MLMDKDPQSPPPTEDDITCQLENLLAGPDFKVSPREIAFLKFVVNRMLAGKASEINNFTLATEVFGRGPDFDYRIDPVVEIQTGILRRKLERYYLTVGKHDSIRIDITPGHLCARVRKAASCPND